MTDPLLNVTPEEREMLSLGSDYHEMVGTDGWKRLLDFIAVFEDQALADLRGSVSADPRVTHALTERWKQRSQTLQAIQNEVLGAISARKQWFEEMRNDPRVKQTIELEELYGEHVSQPGNQGA